MARSGPLDPTRGEALRLESARQACWPVRQQADGIRDEAPLPVPGSARDLGPARGVMTAVGIGLLLWVAALGTIHALTR